MQNVWCKDVKGRSMPSCFSTRMLGLNALGSLIPNPEKKEACAPPDHLPALSCARKQVPNQAVLQVLCLHLFIVDTLLGAKNKWIHCNFQFTMFWGEFKNVLKYAFLVLFWGGWNFCLCFCVLCFFHVCSALSWPSCKPGSGCNQPSWSVLMHWTPAPPAANSLHNSNYEFIQSVFAFLSLPFSAAVFQVMQGDLSKTSLLPTWHSTILTWLDIDGKRNKWIGFFT